MPHEQNDSERRCGIDRREVCADLEWVMKYMDEMRADLYGNGKPGMKAIIQEVAQDVRALKESAEKASARGWEFWLMIMGMIGGPVAAIVVGKLLT